MLSSAFNQNDCYEYALYTRREGRYPNEKYYTTNPLQYLGKFTHNEEWGYGDQHGGAHNFNDNGTPHRIVLDYEGKTCFRKVPCRVSGGNIKSKTNRKYRRNRKSRKSRKNKRRPGH